MLGELFASRFADAANAGANTAAGFGDFFIRWRRRCASRSQSGAARRKQDGCGSRRSRAVPHCRSSRFLRPSSPARVRDFVGRADGDDLAVGDQDCAVFDDAQLAHLRAAAGPVSPEPRRVRSWAAWVRRVAGLWRRSPKILSVIENSRSIHSDALGPAIFARMTDLKQIGNPRSCERSLSPPPEAGSFKNRSATPR